MPLGKVRRTVSPSRSPSGAVVSKTAVDAVPSQALFASDAVDPSGPVHASSRTAPGSGDEGSVTRADACRIGKPHPLPVTFQ